MLIHTFLTFLRGNNTPGISHAKTWESIFNFKKLTNANKFYFLIFLTQLSKKVDIFFMQVPYFN